MSDAKTESPNAALDEQFLDGLFDRMVDLLADGNTPDVVGLLDGREHLLSRVSDLLTLARQCTGVPDPATPCLPGYSVLQKIGEGGMGTVYLARQDRLGGRAVALKVLSANAVGPRSRERLVREAAALARLRHPNIVTVFDIASAGEKCAFAMEWIEGCSLAELIAHLAGLGTPSDVKSSTASPTRAAPSRSGVADDRMMAAVRSRLRPASGQLSERSYVRYVCGIGLAIARALQEVHSAGLLHRDIKPSNILLRQDGTALLSDFGLVRESDATLTQPGSFAGTPAYAPPEQLRGESDKLDGRGDVYALGATLYHALALRLPISASSPAELLRRMERGGPTPLRKLNPRLPVDLETIVGKALEADPQRRYQTAAEMGDDIDRLLALQPIRARPAGLVTRTIKLVRRNRGTFVGVVAGGLSALAVAALLIVYLVWMPRWVAEHTREARLALLDPRQANNIVSVLYWGRFNRRAGDSAEQRVAALDAALKSYNAALRFSPGDAALREERETVAGARAALVGWTQSATATPSTIARDDGQSPPYNMGLVRDSHFAPRLPESFPASANAREGIPAEARARADSRTRDYFLSVADPHSASSRNRGLHAFLIDDYEAAIREWTAYESSRDPLAPPDPLVSAALGVLYLFDDKPARAYPRLRDAVRAFPDVGFLTLYLADAALKSGDLTDAQTLFDRAKTQPRRDPQSGEPRVRAALLAASGDIAAAEAIYKSGMTSGPAILDHARLLERLGRTDESISVYFQAAGFGGLVPRRAYRVALERWWRTVPPADRLRNIRASLDLPPHDPRSLAARIRAYQRPTSNRPPPSQRFFVAPSPFLEFCSALFDTLSSPSLQSLSLSELANRMEVNDMSLWNRTASYPKLVKSLQFTAWQSSLLRKAAEPLFFALRAYVPSSLRAFKRPTLGGAMLIGTATALAQNCPNAPCFQGLGDLPGGGTGSYASYTGALSTDGTTVVGTSGSSGGTEAFRWTAGAGIVGLGDAPGGGYFSGASAPSADGSTVVGYTHSGNVTCGEMEAFRWTLAEGMVLLGDASGGCFWSLCASSSADASIIAGRVATSTTPYKAAYWTAAGWTVIGPDQSSASVISADGTVIAGQSWNPAQVWYWTEPTGLVMIGDLPGGLTDAYVYGISDDGSTVVGLGHSDSGRQGFRWTLADGIQPLNDLPGGPFDGIAYGATQNETMIVGEGNSAAGRRAVIWDSAFDVNQVTDVLAANGVLVPGGWVLTAALDITINGNIVSICGNGTNPDGNPEAWIARYALPSPPCPGDANGDDLVNLSDLSILLANFGTSGGATLGMGDFDGDDDVDLSDLSILLANFGTTC